MYFDRFDIALAHWMFCVLWHGGQNCPLYAKQCRIRQYLNPGPCFSETEFLDNDNETYENAREIYYALVEKHGFNPEE